MAPSESVEHPATSEKTPTGLSFGDGFQFGCGFFVAGLIALIVFVLLMLLLVGAALSLTGFSLFGNLLGSTALPF